LILQDLAWDQLAKIFYQKGLDTKDRNKELIQLFRARRAFLPISSIARWAKLIGNPQDTLFQRFTSQFDLTEKFWPQAAGVRRGLVRYPLKKVTIFS